MRVQLRTWQRLADNSHAELIRLACASAVHDVSATERLRRLFPDAELVRAALTLASARAKASEKFGQLSESIWADPVGVEMASSSLVARYKAERCAQLLRHASALDVCCGIGGDGMALGQVTELVGIDADPIRAWMFERNTGRSAIVARAEESDPAGALLHMDPARRDETSGHRRHALAACRPTIAVVDDLARRARAAILKLGPGVDHAEVASHLPPGELEFISENGRLTQAVLWVGDDLAAQCGMHRATVLSGRAGQRDLQAAISMLGTADVRASIDDDGSEALSRVRACRFVLEADDSVERSGLLHALCEMLNVCPLHPGVGLLAADRDVDSPWVSRFEVLASMPWNVRRVREELQRQQAGLVEVKTRGKAVDPDRLQQQLRGEGDRTLTLFVLRLGRELHALISRRVSRCPQSPE